MYSASVPVFTKRLQSLDVILDKAAAFAEARKIDPLVMTSARLAPDMFPLKRQVQIATDHAKAAPHRLAGLPLPNFEDAETTFPELKARIAKTIAVLAERKPEEIDGSEDRDIAFKVGGQDKTWKGQDYLLNFSLPNFYFHVTTAYAILRHLGVDIGKRDFLPLD